MKTTENNQKTITELMEENNRLYNEYKKYDIYYDRIWSAIHFLMKYANMHISIDAGLYCNPMVWEKYQRIIRMLESGKDYCYNVKSDSLNKSFKIDKEISKMLGL